MDNNLTEKINTIRQEADIVDIVSRHISVVKKGKNHFAVCPFHNDTNPSLSISKDKQIFKCFVCNEAGNVFTFIQKYKKMKFHLDQLQKNFLSHFFSIFVEFPFSGLYQIEINQL